MSRICEFSEGEGENEGDCGRVHCYSAVLGCRV